MAIHTLRLESCAAANEIQPLAERARELEQFVEDTKNVLDAISVGGLLHTLPSDPADAALHNNAVGLLNMLDRNLEALRRSDPYLDKLSTALSQ